MLSAEGAANPAGMRMPLSGCGTRPFMDEVDDTGQAVVAKPDPK